MRVIRSGHFERQVAAELDIEGRPSVRQFEDHLAPIAELVFSAFCDDSTLVPAVDESISNGTSLDTARAFVELQVSLSTG